MNTPPEHKEQKTIGTFMIVAMWILLLALLAFFFEKVFDNMRNPNQSLETSYLDGNVREVELQRNRYGHYVTNGQINGHKVVFMLDTGATGVAVPEHMSAKLGMKRGPVVQIHTANGTAKAYMSSIDRIGIEGIVLEDVRAMLNPNEKGDEILLGMTFLKNIEFTQRGDTLVLRQYGDSVN